jgi:hypothetical protein
MRSRAWSVTERFRRLWSLAPGMAAPGVPGRLRLAYLALRPDRSGLELNFADVLVLLDANEHKLEHAQREFNEHCERLDLLDVPLRLKARLLLLCALPLPGRSGVVVSVLTIAANVRRQLPSGTRCALYNPYVLLQYAVADLVPIEKVFHLAPEYPRIDGVREAVACSATHEILGYSPVQQRLTVQPHTMVEDRAVIRVYLTQILGLVERREEAALMDFVRWVGGRTDTPIEIFLHYLDRDIDEADPRAAELFNEFGPLVRREASLHSLSTGQVSVSGSSSIGYDLLSSDVCHLVVFDPEYHEIPTDGIVWKNLSTWRASRRDVVRFDAPYREWLDALFAVDPATFLGVFRMTPEEVSDDANSQI